jgi:hypothetical protein
VQFEVERYTDFLNSQVVLQRVQGECAARPQWAADVPQLTGIDIGWRLYMGYAKFTGYCQRPTCKMYHCSEWYVVKAMRDLVTNRLG